MQSRAVDGFHSEEQQLLLQVQQQHQTQQQQHHHHHHHQQAQPQPTVPQQAQTQQVLIPAAQQGETGYAFLFRTWKSSLSFSNKRNILGFSIVLVEEGICVCINL